MNQLMLVLTLTMSCCCLARLKIVATTSDIKSLVQEVAKDRADLTSIAKGSQDPHYIEAKPSYMVRVRDADIVVANGLSLEIGWLPSLLRGARNPKVQPGTPGYLELGQLIEPIDQTKGKVTRAGGDVHPDGNPHFTLDPIRNAELAVKIAERLGTLDPQNQQFFASNANAFADRLREKTKEWQTRIQQTGVRELVTYHQTLNYFCKRFGIAVPTFLEDKPGIPPSAQHILSVIDLMKQSKIKLILVDSFFDTKIAKRVTSEVPGSRVASVATSAGATPDLTTLEQVTEGIVRAIEGKQ